jgi:hypothetical protein
VVTQCLPSPLLQSASSPAQSLAFQGSRLLARRIPIALLTFGLGGGAGALLHARLSSQAAPMAPLSVNLQSPLAAAPPPPPVAPSIGPAAVAQAAIPKPPRAPVMQHSPHRPATPPEAEPKAEPKAEGIDRDTALAAERSYLEIARTALGKGDGQGALEALDRYRKNFGGGILAEEEAALRVQALTKLGRLEEADNAAALFHERFPKSLFWPAVQSAIDPAP